MVTDVKVSIRISNKSLMHDRIALLLELKKLYVKKETCDNRFQSLFLFMKEGYQHWIIII